jgi:hypothetical protein
MKHVEHRLDNTTATHLGVVFEPSEICKILLMLAWDRGELNCRQATRELRHLREMYDLNESLGYCLGFRGLALRKYAAGLLFATMSVGYPPQPPT